MNITIPHYYLGSGQGPYEHITSSVRQIPREERWALAETESAQLLLWMYGNLYAETFECFRGLMHMTSAEMDTALELARLRLNNGRDS